MNPEVKEMWVNALESGEYLKGKYRLREQEGTVDKYCCLGVLCDLAVKNTIIPEPKRNIMDNVWEYVGDERAVLPEAVRDWAGLDSENPIIRLDNSVNEDHMPISAINDYHAVTFEPIVKAIKEQL